MNLSELESKVASISLKSEGDPKERLAISFIEKEIPEYHRFWKLYVFPYRDEDKGEFLNLGLPRDHEAMCIYNYSIFRTAYRLNQLLSEAISYHKKNDEIKTSQFNDCMIYIKIGYTQMKHFFGATISCFQGFQLSILINKWETIWNIFDPPASQKRLFNEIKGEEGKIKKYRNFIVHAAKFSGYKNMIPKPEYVNELIYWSDFHKSLLNDKNDTIRKLVDRYVFMKNAVEKFFKLVDNLWKALYDENMKINGEKPPFNEKMIQKKILSSAIGGNKAGPLQDASGSLGGPSPNRLTTASGTTSDTKLDR